MILSVRIPQIPRGSRLPVVMFACWNNNIPLPVPSWLECQKVSKAGVNWETETDAIPKTLIKYDSTLLNIIWRYYLQREFSLIVVSSALAASWYPQFLSVSGFLFLASLYIDISTWADWYPGWFYISWTLAKASSIIVSKKKKKRRKKACCEWWW